MANKRSSRRRVHQFYCPHCEHRLWRIGSPKHFVVYRTAAEIRKNLNITLKKASFLASKGAHLDTNSWLEEFFCEQHGKLWLRVHQKDGKVVRTTLACPYDWSITADTVNPNRMNPSVSEYSLRMSRGIKLR